MSKTWPIGLSIVLTVSAAVGFVGSHNAAGSGFRSAGGGTSGGGTSSGGAGVSGGGGGGIGPTFDPLSVAIGLANSANPDGGHAPQGRGPVVPIESQLAQFLVAASYQNWAPFAGSNGDFQESHGPHGVYHKSYINRTAAGTKPSQAPPPGSILVQENYTRDKKKLLDVVVMCRIPNFDPEHDDWFWVKYRPDGVVSRAGQTKLAGQVVSCIECHQKADGDDLVYGNSLKK